MGVDRFSPVARHHMYVFLDGPKPLPEGHHLPGLLIVWPVEPYCGLRLQQLLVSLALGVQGGPHGLELLLQLLHRR